MSRVSDKEYTLIKDAPIQFSSPSCELVYLPLSYRACRRPPSWTTLSGPGKTAAGGHRQSESSAIAQSYCLHRRRLSMLSNVGRMFLNSTPSFRSTAPASSISLDVPSSLQS
jgi:hypothetical protein